MVFLNELLTWYIAFVYRTKIKHFRKAMVDYSKIIFDCEKNVLTEEELNIAETHMSEFKLPYILVRSSVLNKERFYAMEKEVNHQHKHTIDYIYIKHYNDIKQRYRDTINLLQQLIRSYNLFIGDVMWYTGSYYYLKNLSETNDINKELWFLFNHSSDKERAVVHMLNTWRNPSSPFPRKIEYYLDKQSLGLEGKGKQKVVYEAVTEFLIRFSVNNEIVAMAFNYGGQVKRNHRFNVCNRELFDNIIHTTYYKYRLDECGVRFYDVV